MSDFLAQLLESLLGTFSSPEKRVFVGFLLSAWLIAVVWLVWRQGQSLKDALRELFSRKLWWSRTARADYKLLLANRLVLLLIAPRLLSQLAIATFVFQAMHQVGLPDSGPAWPPALIAFLFTLWVFLLDDCSRYLLHRWMHTWPVLWPFHRVHHSATRLTPLTIFRTHPVEGVLFILRTALVQGLSIGLFVFFFGDRVDLLTVLGANLFLFAFNALGANLRHSEIPLRYPRGLERWLMSPAQHQLHHSIAPEHHHCNFGVVLSVWDRLGGSLQHTTAGQSIRYGVPDQRGEAEHGLVGLYWQPCRRVFDLVVRRVGVARWRRRHRDYPADYGMEP
jgi:sterol desaturase/sphingolipid hydroxylase (fatty acid hydroxylase superfamily)